MSDFARLEKHHGLQVLSFVAGSETESSKYGPCVFTRCDPSITVEITEGPFSDDEAGWNAAEAHLAKKDLAKFVLSAIELTKDIPMDPVEVAS